MSSPFLAEIRIVGFNFAPRGWAFCNGQIVPIAQYTAVFALVGTYYGGNGTSNFGLPNLQGRAPLHQGNGAGLTPRVIGETGGVENVTLLATQMPSHNHPAQGDSTDSVNQGLTTPASNTWGVKHLARTPPPLYQSGAPNASMSATALGQTGSNLPHNNLSPYLVMNFIIALQGIFPSRN